MHHDDDSAHHEGLAQDLLRLLRLSRQRATLVERRRVLRWALGAGLLPITGCGKSSGSLGSDAGTGGTSGATGTGACARIPEETAGPFPGDGSNGPNALTEAGIVRSDIRASFAGMTGTAAGIRLTLTLNLASSNGGCAGLAGAAVYIWHCDRGGLYSLYSAGATDQNYLRGVQEADSDGKVTFTTIFPACYAGRWPHIHFEVYRTLATATAAGAKLATSQLALPQATCNDVFATAGYEQSVANLAQISLATDMVFSDGVASQLPTIGGNVSDGYAASLLVPVPA